MRRYTGLRDEQGSLDPWPVNLEENQENQGSQPRATGFRKAEDDGWSGLLGILAQTETGQGKLARIQEAMVTRWHDSLCDLDTAWL